MATAEAIARTKKKYNSKFRQIGVHVEPETYERWKKFAEENNIPLKHLIINSVERTINENK